jgi:hypothetical protein
MRRTLEDAALRLVDQVFALLREATLQELAELFAAGVIPKAQAPAATRPPRTRRRRRRRVPSPRRSAAISELELRGPAEEITDPGALLEAVAPVEASTKRAPESETQAFERLVTEGRGDAAATVTTSLRPGETIARASGGGLVIRRRRKGEPVAETGVTSASKGSLVHDAPPSSAPTDESSSTTPAQERRRPEGGPPALDAAFAS